MQAQLRRLAQGRQHNHAQHAADLLRQARAGPDVAECIRFRELPQRTIEVVGALLALLEVGVPQHFFQKLAAVLALVIGSHGCPPQLATRKCMTSPSATTYSFPSSRILPASLAATSPPRPAKSSYEIVSARMKPFSKSVWMMPAACG